MYIKHYTGLTRQQRELESRRSTEKRRERKRKKTGDFQRQPGVKRLEKMAMRTRRRRAVNLISAGFLILICFMGKRMGMGRRR